MPSAFCGKLHNSHVAYSHSIRPRFLPQLRYSFRYNTAGTLAPLPWGIKPNCLHSPRGPLGASLTSPAARPTRSHHRGPPLRSHTWQAPPCACPPLGKLTLPYPPGSCPCPSRFCSRPPPRHGPHHPLLKGGLPSILLPPRLAQVPPPSLPIPEGTRRVEMGGLHLRADSELPEDRVPA